MRVLALDTSTPAGSVAVLADDDLLAEHIGDATRPHAMRLPHDLLAALDAARLTTADIDVLAIAVGPGSFTGLRIGIAAMQGLASVTGRRLVPVSLLDALGHVAAQGRAVGARVAAWIDAHRGDVYSALYTVNDGPPFSTGRLSVIDPPRVDRPSTIVEAWRTVASPPYLAIGDGAARYADALADVAKVLPAPALAATVARLARRRADAGEAVPPGSIAPLYIRRPDAEVARDKRRHA